MFSGSDRNLNPRAFLPDGPGRGLSVVALVLVVLFVCTLAGTLFPLNVLRANWQLRFCNSLIHNAPLALLGLAMSRLARMVDSNDARIHARWQGWSQLAVVASLGFVLLLPLQLSAAVEVYNGANQVQKARVAAAERKLADLWRSTKEATDTSDLNRRLQALNGPVLGPADLSQPLPQVREQMRTVLKQAELQIVRERNLIPMANPWRLLPDLLRNAIATLALAVGFAALARRPGVEFSLLQEVERWASPRRQRKPS
ncbi:MAG: hypothetical protein VKO65_08015 [Cyanobacteriota bacterium]|nr:hypothetical protein [Cyanobacteriota bacterium]